MYWKRIAAFGLTTIIILLFIMTTTPSILAQVRLGLDLKGGFEILYEAKPAVEHIELTTASLRQTAKSLEKRVNALGTAEPEIWTEGTNRIRVRLAGVNDETKVRELLKKPAELTVRGPNGQVELLGVDFKEGSATVVYNEMNQPNIQVEVKDKAKLEEVSGRLLGQQIRFNLDELTLTDPVVLAVMSNGIMRITGNYTYDQAKELVDIINMGTLPLQLTEKLSQSVGASLGQQSLKQTLQAGAFGSVLILLFMVFLYRIPGLVSAFTLITYSWLLLIVLNLVHTTMTLPGIAAFVLGIGMAVDANIITYERLKEELASGKSLHSALLSGSKHSARTIMDANTTTLIAGALMFTLGSGALKGFAITLMLSIWLSVLTNVYFSQWLLRLVIGSNLFKDLRWFVGGKQADGNKLTEGVQAASRGRSFDFVRRSRLFFTVSIFATAIGIGSLLMQNLHYGVDFKAGTNLDVVLPGAVTQQAAEGIVRGAGFDPSVLTVGGAEQNRVSMRFDTVLGADGQAASAIRQAFADSYQGEVSAEESTVDPEMAREFARKAAVAVILSSLGIWLYVWFRFEWRFAVAAIIALLHDVFLVVTVFSVFRLEVNLPFIAAMLTIIGYSINDTVVIFDRIRENLRFARVSTEVELSRLVNDSINQTLSRSVNTIVCVLFASVALLVWGSESIRLFSLAMTVGLVAGMYSSIYIASQIWLVLKKRTLRADYRRQEAAEHNKYAMPNLQMAYEDQD